MTPMLLAFFLIGPVAGIIVLLVDATGPAGLRRLGAERTHRALRIDEKHLDSDLLASTWQASRGCS